MVQYDTPSNAYQNGPTVTSPGTGTWTTATVQLTGAQFDEAQNGGADLRLNVTNASAPLIVQSITMSVTQQFGSGADRLAHVAVVRQPGGGVGQRRPDRHHHQHRHRGREPVVGLGGRPVRGRRTPADPRSRRVRPAR